MKSEELEGTKWRDKQDEGRSTNVFLMGVDRGGGGGGGVIWKINS